MIPIETVKNVMPKELMVPIKTFNNGKPIVSFQLTCVPVNRKQLWSLQMLRFFTKLCKYISQIYLLGLHSRYRRNLFCDFNIYIYNLKGDLPCTSFSFLTLLCNTRVLDKVLCKYRRISFSNKAFQHAYLICQLSKIQYCNGNMI